MKEIELKRKGKISRLTNKTFRFDQRIGEGWYSAAYFMKAANISERKFPNSIVTMQFFTRQDAVVCGVDEAIALIFTFARQPEKLIVEALDDGDKIVAYEPVLKITGHYHNFAFLENIIDGILARRTSVATNVFKVMKLIGSAELIFMGDRHDHYLNQAGDGYAAYIGGGAAQVTMAMNEWWGNEGLGTMPHALIQLCKGDIVKACQAYLDIYPNDKLTALVDYNNDVITDSLLVARHFDKKLHAVRIDTSQALIDKYFIGKEAEYSGKNINGVNPYLILALRKALDSEGYTHVKIIVSSGFDEEKINEFKKCKVPIDYYGIGGSLVRINLGFTGDLVRLNGLPEAKAGRSEKDSSRLKKVKYNY